MKKLTVIIILIFLSMSIAAQTHKERNRYFLVSYNFRSSDGSSGEGYSDFTVENGRFLNRQLCERYVVDSSDLKKFANVSIVILNIYEFKNHQDYVDFTTPMK